MAILPLCRKVKELYQLRTWPAVGKGMGVMSRALQNYFISPHLQSQCPEVRELRICNPYSTNARWVKAKSYFLHVTKLLVVKGVI